MTLALVTVCIALSLVELGLAGYLLVRRRWVELAGLIVGAGVGGAGTWIAASFWTSAWLLRVATGAGPNDAGRGFAAGITALSAAFVCLAAGLVGALLLGIAGLAIGDRLARAKPRIRRLAS